MTTETTTTYEPTISLSNSASFLVKPAVTKTVNGKPVVVTPAVRSNIALLDNGEMQGISDINAFLSDGLIRAEVACKTNYNDGLRYSPNFFLAEYERANVGTDGREYPEKAGMGIGVRFFYEEGRTVFVSLRVLVGIIYGFHVGIGRNVPQQGKVLKSHGHLPFNKELGLGKDDKPVLALAFNKIVNAQPTVTDWVTDGTTRLECSTLENVGEYVSNGWVVDRVYQDAMDIPTSFADELMANSGVVYGIPHVRANGTPINGRNGRPAINFVCFVSTADICHEATGIKPNVLPVVPHTAKSDNVTFGAVMATAPARNAA